MTREELKDKIELLAEEAVSNEFHSVGAVLLSIVGSMMAKHEDALAIHIKDYVKVEMKLLTQIQLMRN